MENLHKKKYSIYSIRSMMSSDDRNRETCFTDISNISRINPQISSFRSKNKSESAKNIGSLFPIHTENNNLDSEIRSKRMELTHLNRVIECKKKEKSSITKELLSLDSKLLDNRSLKEIPKCEEKKPELKDFQNSSLNALIIGQKLKKLKDYESRLSKREKEIDFKLAQLSSLSHQIQDQNQALAEKISSLEAKQTQLSHCLSQPHHDPAEKERSLVATEEFVRKKIEHELKFYRSKVSSLIKRLEPGEVELLKKPSFKF